MSPTFPAHGSYGWDALLKEYLDAVGGGQAVAVISDVAPMSPVTGQLWVDTSASLSTSGSTGLDVQISATAPASPVDGGTMWIDTTDSTQFSQTALATSFTPTGTIASHDVQNALTELDQKKVPITEIGAVGGIASLGLDGKVPAAQLPTATGGTPTAASTTFTPVGDISATDVQTAILQLDENKIATSAAGVPNGVATLGPDGKLASSQTPTGTSTGGGAGSTATEQRFVARQVLEDFADASSVAARALGTYTNGTNVTWNWGGVTVLPLADGPLPGVTTMGRVTVRSSQLASGVNFFHSINLPFKTTPGAGQTIRAFIRIASATPSAGTISNPIVQGGAKFDLTGAVDSNGNVASPLGQWTEITVTAPSTATNFSEISLTPTIELTGSTVGSVVFVVDIAAVQQGDIEASPTSMTPVMNALDTAIVSDAPRSIRTLATAAAGYPVVIPGPGHYLIPAQGTKSLLIVPPAEPDSSNAIGAVVDVVHAPNSTSFNVAIPPNVYAASWPGTISVPAGSGFRWRATWLGAGLGYILDAHDIVPPAISALPAATTGTFSMTGYASRQYGQATDSTIQTMVDAIARCIPSNVQTFLNSQGDKIWMADTALGLVTDPTNPTYGVAGLWPSQYGFTDQFPAGTPGASYITAQTISGPVYHTAVHEVCHLIDAKWSAYQVAHGVSGWTLAASAKLTTHPDFVALWNACNADNTLNRGVYAYSSILEFFAETMSFSLDGDTTNLYSIIGSGRASQFAAWRTTIGI